MTVLNDRPGSSTKRQHQILVMAASAKGFDLHELRRLVGGSLRALSALQCSLWIQSFSGKPLPHPPGQAPRPYARKRKVSRRLAGSSSVASLPGCLIASLPSAFRMILPAHIEQIERLGLAYFDGSYSAFEAWLLKYHKVKHPREFATAARAAKIIKVLKDMLARKESP